MSVDPNQKTWRDIRRAQAKFQRAKGQLDEASKERRVSFQEAKGAGMSLAEIAKAVGLHRSRVDQILHGK